MAGTDLLMSVEGGDVFESLNDGDKVYFVASTGKYPGKVVLKSVVTGFKDPGNYVHANFPTMPSYVLDGASNMRLQSANTMDVCNIISVKNLALP